MKPAECALFLARPGVLFTVVLLGLGLVGCDDEATSVPCDGTADCAELQVCVNSACSTASCRTNLDCPSDAICYSESSTCGLLQCRVDADCVARDRRLPYCLSGRCQAEPPPECAERDDCDAGETCVDQVCTEIDPGETCNDDEDCGSPQICDPGQGTGPVCVDACTQDADCEVFEDIRACDNDTSLCEVVECVSAEHCLADEVCTTDYECDFERFPCGSLTCDDPERPFKTEPINDLCRCVQCFSSDQCGQAQGEICTERNSCLYCETAGESADDCPDELPFFAEGCCLECEEDADCEATLGLGAACDSGRCQGCNCNGGCECPEGSDCEIQDDDTGLCVAPLGENGDPCIRQNQCEEFLACSYSDGSCTTQGAGSFCSTGCPEPTRCGATTGGSICYGCHSNEQCPEGFECQTPAEWEDIYDGGQCLPGG